MSTTSFSGLTGEVTALLAMPMTVKVCDGYFITVAVMRGAPIVVSMKESFIVGPAIKDN